MAIDEMRKLLQALLQLPLTFKRRRKPAFDPFEQQPFVTAPVTEPDHHSDSPFRRKKYNRALQPVLRAVVEGVVATDMIAQCLLEIHDLMDGTEWNADTLDEIGTIFERYGMPLQPFNEEDK